MALSRSCLMRLLGAAYKAQQIRSDWDSPGLQTLICQELLLNTIILSINSRINTVSQRMLLSDNMHFSCLGRNSSFAQK